MRVVEERLVGPHRILKLPEVHESLIGKFMQGLQCVFARDRPIKIIEGAGVVGKMFMYVGHHFARDGVGCHLERRWHVCRARLWKRTAIFRIEIPAALQRLIAFHHHVVALTHHAIKIFKANLFIAARPFGEFVARTHEMRVFAQHQIHF